MQKPSHGSLFLILFMMLSYGGYAWLRVQHILRIKAPREFYGTTEFFDIASRSMTSSSFWIATKPPVIPLFYKLLGMDTERIVTAQLWISILSWGALALVLTLVLRNFWLKPFAFALVLAFSMTQNVILWNALIVSESLAISFLALFLASSLWLLERWQLDRLILLAISSILPAFVRDTLAYFLLMAGVSLSILFIFSNRRNRSLVLSSLFVILFIVVNLLSTIGLRWYMPFLMTMGLRILPNLEYVAYFEARGMPASDELMDRAGMPIQADAIAMLYEEDLEEFRQWVKESGRSEFLRFLWFFKADTLQNPLRDSDLVFNPDVYYYAATGYRPILQDARLNELLYPTRFGLLASFLGNIFAIALLYPAYHYRILMWAAPLIFVLLSYPILSYPHAVLIWNADAYEIARHSICHVVMLRLGFWMLVLFVMDFGIVRLMSYMMNRKPSNA